MEDTNPMPILESITNTFPILETTLQTLKNQTQSLKTTYEAYQKGYGGIKLLPTPHAHALFEALQLSKDQAITLNDFLRHFHQYLYQHDLYDPKPQSITLNSLLQTTFSIPLSQTHAHYFSLFRSIPRLFTQILHALPVV